MCSAACSPDSRATPDEVAPDLDRELTRARAKWSARPQGGYRFVIAGRYRQRVCEIDIVVGQRSQFLRNSCGLSAHSPLPTIPELFTAVDEALAAKERCARNGCGCTLRTFVEFDRETGYPRRLRVETDTAARAGRPVSEWCRAMSQTGDDWIIPQFQGTLPGPVF